MTRVYIIMHYKSALDITNDRLGFMRCVRTLDPLTHTSHWSNHGLYFDTVEQAKEALDRVKSSLVKLINLYKILLFIIDPDANSPLVDTVQYYPEENTSDN